MGIIIKLPGKVAVVTGGASGIGEATVREMVKEGAKVVIADLEDELGYKLADELNQSEKNAMFVKTDVTNESDVVAMIKETVSEFGKLDILFNNAGVSPAKFGSYNSTDQQSIDVWRKVISVNLDGVFLVAKHAIKAIQQNGGGSIVNTASVLGVVGKAQTGAYTASKGAVVNFTRTLALEYSNQNIRVNAVCPGYIETPLLVPNIDEDQKRNLISLHPMGRLGKPIEIAKAVVFLASDDASFITGTSLIVDGGYTAQ